MKNTLIGCACIITSPMELTDYKDAIMEAMYRGTKRNVESEPEGKNTAAG